MSLYAPFTYFKETARLLFQKRMKDGQLAFLGDKDGTGARVEVPDAPGYVYARFQNVPDVNGNATFSAPFLVRSGNAAFQNYPGASVYVAAGYNRELEIVSANYQELTRNGVDTRTLNPLHQQSKWVYLWQLTIGLASAVGNSVNNSYLVTVKKYLRYFDNVFASSETGAQADKISLASSNPAVDMHRYATVWLDAYTGNFEVTTSTAQSLFTTLDDSDLLETVTSRPPDAVPHKAFYLANNQGTITQQPVRDRDVRQFLNMPQVLGFPNAVAYRERIHPDKQQLFAGSLVVTGSLQVLGSLIGVPTVSGGGGSTGMTSFTVAADTGTPQTIVDGDTLTIAGGIGIGTVASATDTVTANFDLNTTKGDIAGHNGTNPVRVPVGADGTILVADSADAEGITYRAKALAQQLRVEPGATCAPYTTVSSGAHTSVCLVPYTGQLITLWNGAGWFDYDTGAGGASAVTYLMSQSITGTRVNGSPIITGLASTTNLIVGMDVSGTGIGVAQTILTIDSATQITMTGNATSSGTDSILFNLIDRTVDVFAYQDAGTVKLHLVIWTNDTTRATALNTTTGDTIFKSGDKTKRYLATIRTNTQSKVTVDQDVGECTVWNYYNQLRKTFSVVDTTDSWSYTSTTIRQARATTTNRIRVVAGIDNYSSIEITLTAYTATGSAGNIGYSGIGEDVTNAFTTGQTGMAGTNTTAINPEVTTFKKNVPLGVHNYNWNERGNTGVVFYGDNAVTYTQSGLSASYLA